MLSRVRNVLVSTLQVHGGITTTITITFEIIHGYNWLDGGGGL